jgi:hypothetical protein
MTSAIARPTFYEGEILPAADLGATVDYARSQMARHARYSHSWGIVNGLNLTFASKAVTLSAGTAIDGTGREVVVPADVPLDSTTFLSDVFPQTDPTTLYPVFLNGVDQVAPASSSLTGACGGSQSTSMQEMYNITFRSPGGELSIAEQAAPAITDGPDGGASAASGVWFILLGFVTFDSTNSVFTGTVALNPGSGIGPQYVGVNASGVVSNSGSLLLATHPASTPGANPVMAVQIQETAGGGQLIFGKLGTDGNVTPALTVKANGDVQATGQILGTSIPLSVQIQSGIAFDGMILPLPLGVDPDATNLTVNMHASPHYDASVRPPGLVIPLASPLECTVDPQTRRVSCRMQWWDASVASPWPAPTITPAACDYLVIVTVSATNGASS